MNMPIQELPIVTIENGKKTVYCFEIELKQDDMGYEPPKPEEAVKAAAHDIAVYADTVTIQERLMLPGKSLGIYARKLVLGKGAVIDVSGATAVKTFAAGSLPQQTDLNPGAGGSAGDDASEGGNAGSVTIAVEEIAGVGDGSFAAPNLEAVNLPETLTQLFQKALTKLTGVKTEAFSMPVMHYYMSGGIFGNQPNPYPFKTLSGTLKVPQANVEGLDGIAVEKCTFSGDWKSITLTLSAKSVGIKLAASVEKLQTDTGISGDYAIPFASLPNTLLATVVIQIDSTSGALTGAKVQVSAPLQLTQTPKLEGNLGPVGACVLDNMTKQEGAAARLESVISPAMQSIADAVTREFNETIQTGVGPSFAIYARGHAGGRGQDGHSGIKGSKGENGRETQAVVYESAPGRFNAPPETCGKKGTKGGRAGNAGHSGDGGKGGAIALNFIRSWPLRIVLFADGGPGGEAASAGARGEGGNGGDGHDFLVTQITVTGKYGYTATAPDGPRGDEGDLPTFSGALGKPEVAGSVVVNGQTYSGTKASIAAYSYELMAPLLRLDQILMTQRIGKLVYLNAKARQDYDLVAALFLWLCNVSPDAAMKADAKNSIPLEERIARAAIRSSARVELLRLRQGLDYFGHPYNWAPVLRLKHTQTRVSELIALGRIVEEQYNAYNAENKSIKEKLQALDDTLSALAADLTKSKTAEDALNRQVSLSEGAIASLQTDIDTQIGVMKTYQAKLEEVIQRKISEQCNLENVIKVVSAVIAIGAGAFNGISEIAGAAELAAIAKEAKAAAAAAGELKTEIESILKATGALKDLASQLSAVDAAISAKKPDSVKIAVAKQEFEENIKPVIKEFPQEAKELRGAVRAFFDLAQTRNEKIWDYNALFVRKAELMTYRNQVEAQISSINVIKSQNKEALVPAPYLTFFRSALMWSKENLIRLLYEETRAFCYHTGAPRKELIEELSDLNIGTLAKTQASLLMEYDQFLQSVGRPYADITDVTVTISKEGDPALFESLVSQGRLTFTLSYTEPEFAGLTLVKAESVQVHLPGVKGDKWDQLDVAMVMMGEGAVLPPDKTDEASVVYFNCPPRPVSYKYSFDPDRENPVVQAGQISDDEFAPLSPFTTWTLDFGKKANLNSFVNFSAVDTIELRITGKAFGRRPVAARRPPNA